MRNVYELVSGRWFKEKSIYNQSQIDTYEYLNRDFSVLSAIK
jgi:hypothetical protein